MRIGRNDIFRRGKNGAYVTRQDGDGTIMAVTRDQLEAALKGVLAGHTGWVKGHWVWLLEAGKEKHEGETILIIELHWGWISRMYFTPYEVQDILLVL